MSYIIHGCDTESQVFGTVNYCHFEVILAGDGTVLLQYLDMPRDSGSWVRRRASHLCDHLFDRDSDK
jgi:hypothetical protein